ncbi:hypothetical protein VIGAN_06081200 [Vigna angularis var. angularis]|uniref:Uncharacterized protein n=1 Tax=Vigna angularis var. angularis TaxID=157739 RepID=A0A0S3SAC1_PHAAN|nr:hypothetical protein VIGAN_06081200 [Vigna angularis var. angularis]
MKKLMSSQTFSYRNMNISKPADYHQQIWYEPLHQLCKKNKGKEQYAIKTIGHFEDNKSNLTMFILRFENCS